MSDESAGPTGPTIGDVAPTAAGPALAAGTMVGAFRIERKLGGGGMGTVYEAVDPAIQKRAALKVLNVALGDDAAAVARFEREARAANEIRHPAVVDVFALGRLPDGRPYLVMSLLEGRSLRAEIDARGALDPAETWAIAREVGDALATAHEAGVVHRDLKPDNVFLEQIGGRRRVRVLDFGLAKLSQAGVSLTASGAVMGTPAYMPPEQWWGKGVEAPADQYALGVMLHEMLAGRPPFVADSFPAYLAKHLHESPPSIRATKPSVSEAVEAVVLRALAKEPAARFPTMRALLLAGDRAFGASAATSSSDATLVSAPPAPVATEAARPRRAEPLSFVVLGISVASLVAVGYAGEAGRDPRAWLHIAGWAGPFAVAMFAAGLLALLLGRAPWPLVALLVANGVFGSFTGSRRVLAGLSHAPPTERFTFFNLGIYECNASPFISFGAACALCLALAWRPGATWAHSRERWGAAGALGLLAAAALALGAPSGAWLAAIAMLSALSGLRRPAEARGEISQAGASVLALLLAAAVALDRVHARESAVWDAGLLRAARAAEIGAAASEKAATLALIGASLATILLLEALRLRRLRAAGPLGRPSAGAIAMAAVAALGALAWLALASEYAGTRQRFREELSPQFTLFAHLDPPPSGALDPRAFPTHRAPALQVARNALAVDGKGVATLASLETEEGLAHVGGEINRALAQEAAAEEHDPVDLVVACDRRVPWATLARLLGIARRSGARRVDLLLSRGPAPALPPGAPAEAGWIVSADFVAVPAMLGDDGLAPARDARYGDVAVEVIRRAALRPGSPVALAAPL